MIVPLYVSGLLLRVIRIGVKACIVVTLYAEIFITSIIEKQILIPLRIILTAIWWSTPWSPLYPLARLMARHTSGAVHSMAYYRAYVWSIGDDLRPFSLFCCGQVLSLTQYSHLVTQPRTPSLLIYFELLQNLVTVCIHLKVLLSVLIYPYRSWCSMFK